MIKRKQQGLTLLELLIVLAVAAILVTLAAGPVGRTIERRSLEGVTEELKNQIQMGRTEAMKLNQPVSVRFVRTSASEWCLGLKGNDTAGCDCTVTDVAAADYCEIQDLPQIVSIEAGQGVALDAIPTFTAGAAATDGGDNGFVFDPVHGTLANLNDVGTVTIATDHYEVTIAMLPSGIMSTCYTANSDLIARYPECP